MKNGINIKDKGVMLAHGYVFPSGLQLTIKQTDIYNGLTVDINNAYYHKTPNIARLKEQRSAFLSSCGKLNIRKSKTPLDLGWYVEKYLSYINDYLTVEAFSLDNDFTYSEALIIIELGRLAFKERENQKV